MSTCEEGQVRRQAQQLSFEKILLVGDNSRIESMYMLPGCTILHCNAVQHQHEIIVS